MSDDRPYHPQYYSNLAAGNPIERIRLQIAGIMERARQANQDAPEDQINELKGDIYERGG